jgi:NodT family efflux transporter outer membrane factor (OMF) lipoprotein
VATAAAAAACTVGPRYLPPRVITPADYAETVPTDRTFISPTPADLSAWWISLRDPVLDGLVRRALAGNPDLLTAISKVREARDQVRVTGSKELPTLSGSGNALTFNSDRSESGASGSETAGAASTGLAGLPIPGHLNLYSVGFDATWEIDLFGKTRRAIEAAKDQTQAAQWARRDGQVTLIAEVVNDYLTLRATQVRIAIGEAELKREQALFKLIRDRRITGFVTNLDVNQQSVQVATAAAQIPQLQAQAQSEVHALGVLVGEPPESLDPLLDAADPTLPPTPPALPVGMPSDLLRRRPDVREAERRVAAANAEIGEQEAELYPSVNLYGLGSFAGMSIGDLFSRDNLQSVGLGTVSIPIFNAGRTLAQIREAKEQKVQAELAYRKAVYGAFRDVEDALARYRSEDARHRSLQGAVASAENTLKIAEDQYAVGAVTFINVLQAENALLERRDLLAQSEAQSLTDLVALYKALGGGYQA